MMMNKVSVALSIWWDDKFSKWKTG